MIGGIVKKLFSKKQKKEEKPNKNLATSIKEKSQELSEAFSNQCDLIKNELITMHAKCGNLLETNYNLGLKHIDNGNLSDAIFRFRFIKKFWPNHLDSQFQLAYCLLLDKKTDEAVKILEDLLNKDPNHKASKDMLELVRSSINQESSLPNS